MPDFLNFVGEGTLVVFLAIVIVVLLVAYLGSRYKVQAHIEAVDSFSGHADHSELIDYFNRTTGPKERVWLVHGEPEAGAALRESLQKISNGSVEVAETGVVVEF